MSIDEENPYRITERLAFPRLVGTQGELKAQQIIKEELLKAGYQDIKAERFKTSMQNWILARYLFIPLAIFLILMGLSFYFSHWLTLVLIAILVFVAIKMLGVVNSNEIALSKNEKNNMMTENYHIELKSKNSKAIVVFLGHYDSKSQTFPSAVRIAVIMLAAFGALLLLFLYLILSIIKIIIPFDAPLLNLILFWMCVIIGGVGILNYFNKTGNKSPGAYDNAGAVATVIELARYYKKNPLDNIDFIFLITSSEELNLGGAKFFIKNHKSEFDPKKSYFINFDGIGGTGVIRLITAYGIPRKSSSKKLNDLLIKSSKELNIEAKVIYLPTGAWSDFMPIIKEGFESCWLGSSGGGLKYVHTKRDNMSLISKQGLKNGLLLSIEVVKKLNDELN